MARPLREELFLRLPLRVSQIIIQIVFSDLFPLITFFGIAPNVMISLVETVPPNKVNRVFENEDI